jgi:tetratricopeptide (TPR) repeat protein
MLKHDVLDAEERERAARTLTEVTPAYYLGNNISRMFYANLRSMNLTERALSRPLARGVVAECYATSALIASATGARRISDYYEELTRTILPRVEDPVSLGQAHMLFGLRYMGEGRCLQARTQAEQACQLFEAAGHRRRYEVAAGTKAFILGYLGDYDSAITQWTDIERLGRARQHPQSIGLSLHGLAECLLAKEDDRQIEHVRRSLAEASRAYPPGNDLMFDIQASALRGETELRMARLDEAREHFTRAVTLIETTVPLSAYAMSSYGRVAWGVHALLRKGAVPRTLAGRATKNLRQFGRAFRLAEPAALACQAMLAAHDGKTAKAQRLELKATALAASLQLPLLPTLARAP